MDQNSNSDRAKWPAEHIKMLMEGWARGDSMGVIGIAVGRSRSAVAGQITKLRNKGVLLEGRRAMQPKLRAKHNTLIPIKPRPIKAAPSVPEKPRFRLKLIESPIAVTFAELKGHHCKFPLGDPRRSDFRFCGGRRLENKPYCQEHTTLTEQPLFRRAKLLAAS